MARLLPAQIIAVETVLKQYITDPALSVMGIFMEALDAYREAAPAKRSRNGIGAKRLPEDVPTAAQKQAAQASWRDVGRHDLVTRVAEIADGFRAYHLAHGSTMESWGHAWATWYRRTVQIERPSGQLALVSGSGGIEDTAVSGWLTRLEIFAGKTDQARNTWRVTWGPKPREDGCRVPQAAYDEFFRLYPKRSQN